MHTEEGTFILYPAYINLLGGKYVCYCFIYDRLVDSRVLKKV